MNDQLLLARQPILDRSLRLRGYELLARDAQGHFPARLPGHVTTSRVLIEALSDFGLENVVGRLPAFVNLTREFLTGEIPLPLPPERVVLEVLESVEPDAAVLAGLRRLKAQGFELAVDDYAGPRAGYDELLRLVDIVKVDCLGRSAEELRAITRGLAPFKKRLLAEKIEHPRAFHAAEQLGFELFQGFFFAKPDTLRSRAHLVDRSSLLRLMARLQEPDATPEDLEQVIAGDPVLSLKLVRFLNSAQIGLRRHIDSLREVVVYLGSDTVRNFACLMMVAGVDDKPRELLVTTMMRAKMCEELGRQASKAQAQRSFTVGLFSTLDALLDRELREVLGSLPLHAEIRAALLERAGELGRQLESVVAYERGEFDKLPRERPSPQELRQAFLDAVRWVARMEEELATAG